MKQCEEMRIWTTAWTSIIRTTMRALVLARRPPVALTIRPTTMMILVLGRIKNHQRIQATVRANSSKKLCSHRNYWRGESWMGRITIPARATGMAEATTTTTTPIRPPPRHHHHRQ